MEYQDKVEKILIPKGTLIHIDGLPFEIKQNTEVLGVKANLRLTDQLKHYSDTSEQLIEQEIQEKGLNAPRLTPDHIDSVIIGETYTNLPDGRTVVCQLTLKNGYTIDGKSACVSKENFNQEIGNKIARQNAREKIWELEGYLLKQKLYEVAE